MFGLFKRKDERYDSFEGLKRTSIKNDEMLHGKPEKPYEPEKPVRELFEAVKDSAILFNIEDKNGRVGVQFDFDGMVFESYLYHSGLFCLVMLSEESLNYRWLSDMELNWLHVNLVNHIKQKKRQEFIDALCSHSSI